MVAMPMAVIMGMIMGMIRAGADHFARQGVAVVVGVGIDGQVLRGLGVKTANLDPLEQGPNPGPDAYFADMERLADTHVTCLSR